MTADTGPTDTDPAGTGLAYTGPTGSDPTDIDTVGNPADSADGLSSVVDPFGGITETVGL